MRLPLHLLWLTPPRSPLTHAWVTMGPGRLGVCLCGRYRKKLQRIEALTCRLDAVRCETCVMRSKMMALALPHADAAATELLGRAGVEAKRWLGL